MNDQTARECPHLARRGSTQMISRNHLPIGPPAPDRRKSPRKLQPSASLAPQFLKQADMFPQGSIKRNASQEPLQIVSNHFQPSSQVRIHRRSPQG